MNAVALLLAHHNNDGCDGTEFLGKVEVFFLIRRDDGGGFIGTVDSWEGGR